MKIVLVSQNRVFLREKNAFIDGLDVAMSRFVQMLGYTPVSFGNENWGNYRGGVTHLNPKAVFLTGGNSIGEYLGRDRLEMQILQEAESLRIPVIGICRGAQVMNSYFGGSIDCIDGHAGTIHDIRSLKNVRFPRRVKSYHNYAISSLGSGLEVLAEAPDGSPEAVAHIALPWLGLLWHPEREERMSTAVSSLILDLVESGRPVGVA